jgi:RNA polymerase sigma-70 factor (ECF subfamily)
MSLDHDEFVRLYRTHASALLVFFQRRVFDAELAMDLMADTFTVALDRGAAYRGSTARELSGWLWSIARSTLHDHELRVETRSRMDHRISRERRALSDGEIERIEELAGLSELRDAVRDHLDRLPEEQRTAVCLRVLEDMSYADIATRLDIAPAAARMRVSRGFRNLAKGVRDLYERGER